MRIVLDECLPRKLKAELKHYYVRTAQEQGWAGLRNGDLLQVASSRFDVFLTVDRSIAFQQTLKAFEIAVVMMVAKSNRLRDLLPLMKQVREVLPLATPGGVIRVGDDADRFTLKESAYRPTIQAPIRSWS